MVFIPCKPYLFPQLVRSLATPLPSPPHGAIGRVAPNFKLSKITSRPSQLSERTPQGYVFCFTTTLRYPCLLCTSGRSAFDRYRRHCGGLPIVPPSVAGGTISTLPTPERVALISNDSVPPVDAFQRDAGVSGRLSSFRTGSYRSPCVPIRPVVSGILPFRLAFVNPLPAFPQLRLGRFGRLAEGFPSVPYL